MPDGQQGGYVDLPHGLDPDEYDMGGGTFETHIPSSGF